MNLCNFKNLFSLVAIFVFGVAITACKSKVSSPQDQPAAVELNREHTCKSDGMILMDYAGPKAQLVLQNGERYFYCEAREAFTPWLNPIQRKRLNAFYVQDFGGVVWGSHSNRWFNAADAFFVVDSHKKGAMGVSYVPFSKKEFAEKFIGEHGGRLLTLNQITASVLQKSQALQLKSITHDAHIK